jgi:nucleoside-diphosphate-sugar epimerase
MTDKILVIGSSGQIGTELVLKLREMYGDANVVATDIREPGPEIYEPGPFELLNVLDAAQVYDTVKKHRITQIYLLAAMLSATAEKHIEAAWRLNMKSLLITLDLAREKHLKKVYWPSSIAVFGPHTPQIDTPQDTTMDPNTVYGISKLAGERWCEYFNQKFGVDVRSLRYPGVISWKAEPGGGTTDYAIHAYYEALRSGKYESFLKEGTMLPMIYMPDAIRATVELMEAPSEKIKIRSSYNLAGVSFAPEDVAASIRSHIPDFKMTYKSDFRQAIADTWPKSIDDGPARTDWGWKHEYGLDEMSVDMIRNLKVKLEV